ncbi:cyclin-domain-containing protein [Cokeromyces recurvatus]|uniref:cyclin-domain-containing protein n=1 Tax=Cokeromyces recurvatus TaxID=90255 RepID=UPI00221EDBDA|nr:cyclin-domain-containing protein [Cokeromyces recurvatus]KAI7907620.1 cyclin-domain-containing protein [Cokeromyces recurvatus]
MTKVSLLSITDYSELAEFCAVIIPCIWARSYKKPILSPKRHAAFKLYIHKVLKATQISCTCMLLALYYIQRLRLAYPVIHASIGSEVRLFTTSLILANKYLDDNTFTNKTWSDVSKIPVHELNIMEIEFLSALDYNLHTSDTMYYAWILQCQTIWSDSLMHSIKQEPYLFVDQNNSSMKRKLIQHEQQEDYHTTLYQNKKKKNSMTTTPTTLQQQPLYSYPTPPSTIICKPILSWSSSIQNNVTTSLISAIVNQQHYYLTPATSNSYYYMNNNNNQIFF